MKFFLSKVFVLLLVFGLVQIPVHWVEGITHERMSFKNEATRSVSNSYAGHQFVAGPVLMFPYTHTYWEDVYNKDGVAVRKDEKRVSGTISVLPKTLDMMSDVTVEERKIGIFPVPVFKAGISIKAAYAWDALINPVKRQSNDDLQWGQPYLSLPLADQHGIKSIDTLTWLGKGVQYLTGSAVPLFNGQGIHALVVADTAGGSGVADIKLTLIGTELLRAIPTADQAKFSFSSNWPHPQFLGSQLPDTRDISSSGFSAHWQSTSLATNIQSLWNACSNSHCQALENESLGVQMIDPTNFYTKMTRALKYGFMFTAITFIAFILFEVLCDLRIHPVQYTLLGVASGVFFLLLLSFSEHVGFAYSYTIASSACLALLSLYANALLKHWKRTLSFSGILATLYAVLFIILEQEDAALLTGSLLIFGLLAVAMVVTRNIDWYAWQERFAKPVESAI